MFYTNPLFNTKIVNELDLKTLRINYIIFLANKTFNISKVKQKGRLKRKIGRKVIKINNLKD